ncbi:MAG: sulfite exporter TauE/SafE family protein [Solirubrobacterales bacterium]|jgi:hypothetical protein
MEMLLAIPFGLAIGAVVGTVGGGGAILALPVLVYVLDQGVSSASTASLIVVAVAASVGAGSQARDGHVCWRVALIFSVPAAAGAYAGTVANGAVSAQGLILAFVPVMLTAALLTYHRGDDPGSEEVFDRCPEPSIARAAGAGVVVGSMTGFFGVGGGFLIVPALTLLLGLGMRRAIATSLAIITLTGAVALISHLARGADPDWPLTIVLAGSAAVGALGGSALGRRVPVETLARAFAVVVAVVAIFLLVDVLALGGPPVG